MNESLVLEKTPSLKVDQETKSVDSPLLKKRHLKKAFSDRGPSDEQLQRSPLKRLKADVLAN
jgi:hypothetical protein